MANLNLRGTGVALITPFRADSSIDFKSLGKVVDYVINNNVNYVVVLGTTGEAASLNQDEKNAVVNYVIDTVNNRVPIIIGIGGNNTNQIVSTIQSTDFSNISAILSVSPYYNKPNQKGIYQHYKAISGFSPVPVILYNVPGRTGSNIEAETTLKLANDFSNIIAVKEASGNIGQIGTIIKNKPDDFFVLSGDDLLALPLIAMGADGIISVTANAFPKEFTQLINNALKGDFNTARKYHFQLIEIMHELFADGNPAGIKAALSIKGFITNHLRLPLVHANRIVYNQLVTLISNLSA